MIFAVRFFCEGINYIISDLPNKQNEYKTITKTSRFNAMFGSPNRDHPHPPHVRGHVVGHLEQERVR